LADLSFEVHKVVDQSLSGAVGQISKILKDTEDEVSLLLFYYFGHAIADDNDLRFFFKDSQLEKNTTMLAFTEVAQKIEDYQVPKTVFVFDCCYAGAAAIKITEIENHDYFMMASATPKQKALIDYGQKYPIGYFTKEILGLIGSPEASEFVNRQVTFRNVFNRAKEKIGKTKLGQNPQYRDTGIGDEVFFTVNRRPELRKGLNKEVHPKSLYWKIFKTCLYLSKRRYRTLTDLYQYAQRKQDPSFLTPIKGHKGSISYEFVSANSFHRYVQLLRSLGAVNANGLELTSQGRVLIQEGGENYNRLLISLITDYWKRLGITTDDIEEMVASRMKSNRFPEIKGLYSDFFFRYQAPIGRSGFQALMDLASSCGALKFCTDKIYFVH